MFEGVGPTNSNSYPPDHPPEALAEIEPSLLPATQVILVCVSIRANAAVGPVMVKFYQPYKKAMTASQLFYSTCGQITGQG
jgi:hypothetical protein